MTYIGAETRFQWAEEEVRTEEMGTVTQATALRKKGQRGERIWKGTPVLRSMCV